MISRNLSAFTHIQLTVFYSVCTHSLVCCSVCIHLWTTLSASCDVWSIFSKFLELSGCWCTWSGFTTVFKNSWRDSGTLYWIWQLQLFTLSSFYVLLLFFAELILAVDVYALSYHCGFLIQPSLLITCQVVWLFFSVYFASMSGSTNELFGMLSVDDKLDGTKYCTLSYMMKMSSL